MKITHILLTLGIIAGCTASNNQNKTSPTQVDTPFIEKKETGQTLFPPETGEPALHAIRDQQLEDLMLQINGLVYGKMRNEIDLKNEKKIHTTEIAKIAHELAMTVDYLREAMPRLNLLPNEQGTFLALADKLKSDAKQIEEFAKRDEIQYIPVQMQQIMATCTSCHSLFRNSRNLLDRCRDPKNTC